MTRGAPIPPPIAMVLAGVVAWLLSLLAPGLALHVPLHRTLAVLITLAGIALAIVAKRTFDRAGTTVNPLRPDQATQLVTTGVFRHSRNPMYVGQCLSLAGWCMWLDNALAWVAVPMLVAYLTVLQIKAEERVLSAKFGEAYAVYRSRVRRWI
ncbi:isoprenylcysteine carboxylmethyltransferase family protein [Lysobacter sp. KIS68-7]|uniref:methyltransferase family protein n=1 Tax=Lysobacter sp. KIS68-7 TaxID=2904252 RepID=UPI001E31DF24|nr:isoprenylcysteine carboxylmethyltransferase family protein [Lysobacter sp. KIS68-7]UHQ18549.1 isoprenylcysteine carboxylmethyltransferase family protein [Lysobacter sp. KIS68-7]